MTLYPTQKGKHEKAKQNKIEKGNQFFVRGKYGEFDQPPKSTTQAMNGT